MAAVLAGACGKKGPPLAPVVRIPAPVEMLTAQRSGSDVFITLTIPAKNIDGSMPVDIGRIEIYGYTGRRAPASARFVEVAELVATIPVIPPPPPDAPPVDPAVPPDLSKGALTGTMVTLRDELTAGKLVQGKIPEEPVRGRPLPTPVVATSEPDVLRRFYIAIAFSARGRPGPPPAAPAEFPLVEAPEAPAFVNAHYTETTMEVEWPPSGGIIGYLLDRTLPPEDVPLNDAFEPIVVTPPAAPNAFVPPSGPVTYNIYRELAPDPLAYPDLTPAVPWTATKPAPINLLPLATTSFMDSVELDRQRCYVVRPMRGTAPNVVEGAPSPPYCFIPVDLFPPAAPVRLAAVADEGGISLIWEPNAEPDVTGYMVLRGEPTDATLQPLTPAPVAEARFRDTDVTAGKKYVYAVVALDSRLPVANVSAESNRAEETAR